MKAKSSVLCFLSIMMITLLILPGVAAPQKQPNAEQAAGQKDEKTSKVPDLAEVVIQAAELENRLSDLRDNLKKLIRIEESKKAFLTINENISKISEELRSLQDSDKITYEQLTATKTSIRLQDAALKNEIDSVSAAVHKVGTWNREWAAQKRDWEMWRAALLKEVPMSTLESSFARSQEIITEAQSLIFQHLEPLLAAQLEAKRISIRTHTLTAKVNEMILALTGDVLQDTSPSMFSSRYTSQFSTAEMSRAWRNILALLKPDLRFFLENGTVIALQGILVLLTIAGIRRYRDSLDEAEPYRFVVRHPIACSLLPAVIFLVPFYGPVSPFWQLVVWGVGVFSTARLAGSFPSDRLRRWPVYGFAAGSVATDFFLAANLPLPILHLYLMAVGAAGLAYFAWHSIRNSRRHESSISIWFQRLASALFLVLLLFNILGYVEFAGRVLDSSLRTFFLILQGWIILFILRSALKVFSSGTLSQKLSFLGDNAHRIVKRSTMLINLLVGVFVGIWLLVSWRIYQDPVEALQHLLAYGITVGSGKITVGLILGALGIFYSAFLISWSIQALLMEEVLRRRQVEVGVRQSVSRLLHYALVLVGFIAALVWLGFDMRNLTILGGALGVGIGFGLQTVVNNFVCGLIMLFERPIKVGDSIQLGDEFGRIKKVGLRATVVETYDNSEIVVPNSDLITSRVTNWTLADRKSRIRIPIGVAYGSDVALVMQTLADCAKDHPLVLEDPAPGTVFMGFGESSLDFELRAWVKDFNDRLQAASDLRMEIDTRFRAAEIEIPFPQRDVHLRSTVAASPPSLQGRESGGDQPVLKDGTPPDGMGAGKEG